MTIRRVSFSIAALSAVFLFLTLSRSAQAAGDIVITEIAASPANKHEWVELYNRGAQTIDLAGWSFWEDNTNHKLTFTGTSALAPGDFAIIAQDAATFSADYPTYTGMLIDSSWSSLKESGEEIGLKDAQGILVEIFTYVSAPDQFLNRINSALDDYSAANWIEAQASTGALWQNVQPPAEVVPETIAPSEEILPTEDQNKAEETPAVAPGSPFHYSFGNVWINEIVSNPVIGENEWVEIKSNHINNIDLTDWKLKDGSDQVTALTGTLLAFGYTTIEKPKGSLNNSGDRVTLIDHENNVIDELMYGDFSAPTLTAKPSAPGRGQALARVPDALNTNKNNIDFVLTVTPTKDSANTITAIEKKIKSANTDVAVRTTATSTSAVKQPEELFARQEFYIGGMRAVLTVYAPSSTAPLLPSAPLSSCEPLITAVAQELHTSSSPETEGKEKIATSSILQARSAPTGSTVIIQGVVNVLPGVLGTQYFYIQDEAAGIQIYQNKKDFPSLSIGDAVEVRGEKSIAYGEPRIKVKTKKDIAVRGRNKTLQSLTITLDALEENHQGRLVHVEGLITERASDHIYLDDGGGELRVGIRAGSGITPSELEEGATLSATGILIESRDKLQLLPRNPNDIKVISPAKTTDALTQNQTDASSTVPVAVNKTAQRGSGSDPPRLKTIVWIAGATAGAAVLFALLAKRRASGIMR